MKQFKYPLVHIGKDINYTKKTGVDLNIINGLGFRNKFLVGIGFGYLNFEDINGLSVFSDFEYLPLKPDYHR